MTESKTLADASADDVTARVLTAAKNLRDGFEEHYSAVATKVKKENEGPVKVIDTGDDIPITMQLSVWDTKVGPVPAILVGGGEQLATITTAEQEDTTRMIDVLAVGATCDLSKAGVNRLLLKFAITDPRARGGESWFLLATYYTHAVDVPRAVIEEMFKELATSIRPEADMASEAMAIREAYDPANSRWRELLQEMRLSIWALVQKAGEMTPPPIPGLATDKARALLDEEVRVDPVLEKGDKKAKRKKKAKPNPDAVKAGFFSAVARVTLSAAERTKEAIATRIQARKAAIVVPPVAEVVANPSPVIDATARVEAPLPAAAPESMPGQVAHGFPTAPPHLMALASPPPPTPGTPPSNVTTLDPVDDVRKTTLYSGIEYRGDPGSGSLASIGSGSGTEPVPVQITITKPSSSHVVTPKQPGESPVAAPKRLAAIEAGLIEVLGKLQRSGYSLKVNKDTGEATACKLVELDPGKGGLLALFLSFHARFLPHAVLHEIDGRFFAGDERVATRAHRPTMRVAIASHMQGVEDIVYRGKSIGKVYKERPLKAVIVPLVLVRSTIKGTGADVPFKWVEPNPADGVEHGHFVVATPEIDRAEAFIMNSVRVLGPRMVAAEAQHVEATEADLLKSGRAGWAAAAAISALAAVGILAAAHWLPIDATVAILQYWYVLAGVIVLALAATANLYQKLDQRVNRAIDSRLQEVTNRTPLLVKPGWEVLIDAARRVGKADFSEFKAAFCQELDPLAVDETVEVVWQQDAPRQAPVPKEVLGALDALAKAAKKAKTSPIPVSNPARVFTGGLKVTESGGAVNRKKRTDDDILDESGNDESLDELAAPDEVPDDVYFDPLAALKGK